MYKVPNADILAELNLSESDFQPKTSPLKDEEQLAKLSALMDCITIDRYQSDKLGYDWEVIKLGEQEVKKTYVAQLHPVGTADNPIVYTDGVALILNAYYMKDGVRQVWMGEWVEF